MKTYHIKDLLKKDLLIIELPEKIDRCWVLVHSNHIWINNRETGDIHRVKGSYTLLGKPDEISEEDAEPLVVSLDIMRGFGHDKETFYHDYINDDYGCKTATESLLSAIESVIFWENPYSGVLALEFPSAFENAELRTFDRSRSIIFVKN